jgi:hypothetical protein
MRLPRQAEPVVRSVSFARTAIGAAGVSPSAACISVTITPDHKACLNLPIVGSVCIPVPDFIPSGSVAQACIDVCTHWGFPTGACVTLDVGGQQVCINLPFIGRICFPAGGVHLQQCFGWC